jgi:hypothetical protein
MTTSAKGAFTVKMAPQAWSEGSVDHSLGRFLLDKQYQGDLEATSQGQMLSAGSGAQGSSGAYVALEKVTGTLQGRKGSFVLYHVGIMTGGVPDLKIHVVPGSAADELHGLAGEMTIQITDGKHSYDFSYTLATIQ